MAPEIKLGQIYKGKEVDIFSIGVILFIMVQGIYPFNEAIEKDYFYSQILKGDLEMYWSKVGKGLSPAFKNFIIKFFTLKGCDRITLEQIKNDPWYNEETNISDNEIKRNIIEKFEKNGGAKGAFKIEEE
jgi:MAP/microtubule affinity-regulating kinase